MTTRRESVDADPSTSSPAAKSKPSGTIETVLRILHNDGISAFWQGVIPALILVINPIIQYTVFEQLKTHWRKKFKKLGNFDFFLLGAISKLAATGLTYPYM